MVLLHVDHPLVSGIVLGLVVELNYISLSRLSPYERSERVQVVHTGRVLRPHYHQGRCRSIHQPVLQKSLHSSYCHMWDLITRLQLVARLLVARLLVARRVVARRVVARRVVARLLARLVHRLLARREL